MVKFETSINIQKLGNLKVFVKYDQSVIDELSKEDLIQCSIDTIAKTLEDELNS